MKTNNIKIKSVNTDPGPCYRCHQWPCDCKEGPLMENPALTEKIKKEIIEMIEPFYNRCNPDCEGCNVELDMMACSIFYLFTKDRKRIIKKIEKLIVEEMLIAQKEGQPTSRLTSLLMKIKKLEENK
jgi:hypothetical protein